MIKELMSPYECLQQLPTLSTRRLVLRKLRMADASAYFAFASDPQVVQYLRWGPHASLQETQTYLAGVLESYRQGSDWLWGIQLAAEHRLIGAIHLMDIDAHDGKADVGVVVHANYWGLGLGSEALHRVLAFGFVDLCLQRVQGLAIPGNTPACRMMEKCGMTHAGVLHRYAMQKGTWWDVDIFSIAKDEFR
jgi:ribosomal-protein-alanine N-acetyltransferase